MSIIAKTMLFYTEKIMTVNCVIVSLTVSCLIVYDLRVIVAVVVIHQLDIRTCTAQNCSQTLLRRFNDAVITFLA